MQGGSATAIEEAVRSGAERVFVAEFGERVAGYGSLAFRNRPHLWAVYVRPQDSGKGVCRRLVERIRAEVRAAGYRDLHAAASLATLPFYQSQFFDPGSVSCVLAGG